MPEPTQEQIEAAAIAMHADDYPSIAWEDAHEADRDGYRRLAEVGLLAALSPDKRRTEPLPEGMVRKGGRNVVPDDFERPAPPPAFKHPDKRREE